MSKEHTANFIVSKFLSSKRSVKKTYQFLNPALIGVLRYICDSIDLNYSKRQRFNTGRLLQAQIAKYCHCSLKSVSRHIGLLIKKRLLKYDTETFVYSLGRVLICYVKLTYPIDVGQFDVAHRCKSNLRTSNSSNFTNKSKKSFYVDKPKKLEEKHQPAETAKMASDLLEAFMRDRQKI